MGARFGLRGSGLTAALACALLVACGGGGGGGGGGGVIPTPVPTAALNPTTVSATGTFTANVAPPAATFTGVSNGTANVLTSGSVTMPTFTTNNSASFTLSGVLPTGVTAPSARSEHWRSAKMLGVANTPIVYVQVTFASNATFSSSPAFVFNFPAALSGNAYVVVSGSTIPNGWNEVAGPGVYSNNNTTLTFGAVTQSPAITLNAGVVYTFALVTTGSLTIPTPTPVATATGTPTPQPPVGQGATLPPVFVPSTFNGGSGYAPYDVANNFKYLVQNGYDGTGKTVAIIGDDPPLTTDMQGFLNQFQIPSSPLARYSVVTVTGSTNLGADAGGQDEATLDVETVMGLAPGSTIKFYNTQGDLSNAAFLAGEQQVKQDNPDVFSISFGGCEQYPLPTGPNPVPTPPDAPVFSAMNAAGVAVTVSSGDEGDNCTTGTTPADAFGVNYPGSDPSVIGVGGNESNPSTATLVNPVAWNDNFFSSGQGATGGGVSTTFGIPSYQTGVSGKHSSTMRNVPDISMPAEGVVIYRNGRLAEFGGTSWSAPEVGAMMAELDEYCSGRPTNPVAEFYNAYTKNSATFIDITSGDNHWASESVTYAGAPGYDNTTGLGMPLALPLAQSMCPSKTWTGGRAFAAAVAMPRDQYGEMRDTQLGYVQRFARSADLGERSAGDSTRVVLVMRNTPTAAADEQTVIAALRSAGFSIAQTFDNHSLIVANAPASAVGSYFRTSIHTIDQGRYGTRYANVSALTLPASIAPYVHDVLADNLVARTPKHYVIVR